MRKFVQIARILATLFLLIASQRALAGEVTALLFLPDGTLVAANAEGSLRLLDGKTGQENSHFEAHPGGIFGIAVALDGKTLASCGADGKIKLWKVAIGQDQPLKEARTLAGHEKEVVAVAFSPDGSLLASGGYDSAIRIWDVATGKSLKQLEGQKGRTTALAFFPDGKKLASGGNGKFEFPVFQDDKIHFWDVSTGKLLESLSQEAHQLALSPDGRRLAAVRDYTTFYKKKVRTTNIESHTELAIWDVARGRELFPIREPQHTLALSPDGSWLALGWGSGLHRNPVYHSFGTNKGLQIIEMASGNPVLWLKASPEDAVVVAFSPDGTRLAAGTMDGKVNVHPLGVQSWQPGRRLKSDSLDELWKALADEDAALAYEAVELLTAKGDTAAAFLKERLIPVAPLGAKVRKLVDDLGNENFRTRDSAYRELQRMGSAAELELRRILPAKLGLEAELRLKKLLNALPAQGPTAEEIRQCRAVVALTRISEGNARRLLETLAAGEPTAWLTQEAQAGLRFLSRR